jgi:hypothetical protein
MGDRSNMLASLLFSFVAFEFTPWHYPIHSKFIEVGMFYTKFEDFKSRDFTPTSYPTFLSMLSLITIDFSAH